MVDVKGIGVESARRDILRRQEESFDAVGNSVLFNVATLKRQRLSRDKRPGKTAG